MDLLNVSLVRHARGGDAAYAMHSLIVDEHYSILTASDTNNSYHSIKYQYDYVS